MTLAEFKAWFEGFTEGMDGPPDAKQWKRIKARVAGIDGVAVTYPAFVDRYLPSPKPWREWRLYSGGASSATLSAGREATSNSVRGAVFDGNVAMYAAGRADAEDIAAA